MSEHIKQKTVAPWWVFALIAIFTVILLFLFNPKSRILNDIESFDHSDEVINNYLDNMISNDSENQPLRLELILKKVQSGNIKDAERYLKEFTPPSEPEVLVQNYAFLIYEIAYHKSFSMLIEEGLDAFPKEVADQLINEMRGLKIDKLNATKLGILAQQAVYLNDPEYANKLYTFLGEVDKTQNPQKFIYYAKIASYAGEHVSASNYYFAAQRLSRNIDENREYYMLALNQLKEGNDLERAMRMARQNIGFLIDDRKTLIFLTQLALLAGQPKIAQYYINKVAIVSEQP